MNLKTLRILQSHQRLAGAMLVAGLCTSPLAQAGATFKIDETKWISIGAGLRTSFAATEDIAGRDGGKWSKDFDLNNIRLYLNGQLFEYLKLEFNTECENCSDDGDLRVLDAIGKFEFNKYLNIWFGRMLVAADRAELNGPFYQNVFEFNKTPFYPSDFSSASNEAGRFGRDDGIQFWGTIIPNGRLTYVAGVFDGLDDSLANQDDNLLYAARLSFNFLNIEENPGYYTSSTYYGKAGDILTLAAAFQYQEDGAGAIVDPADFFGTSVDLLFEKVLPNEGVFTFEGEYKYFNLEDISFATLSDPTCFCMFEGDSYTGTALYLFPQKVLIGQFQPYVRYTNVDPQNSSERDEIEAGVNYVIDGHNARVSLFYEHGDIATEGLDYRPGVRADEVSAVKLGLQIQL
ncbi:MAG: hypothetical protein H0T87_13200 [Gammaproteobacteria bacterium]|nr:hypothetical protein [Gammaproteobacteria bacterium]